jgi:hypothetical protein
MIHDLEHLYEKESITTGEALLGITLLCRKYHQVLQNIIRIKEQTPEISGERFRKSISNLEKLQQLEKVLQGTQKLMTEQSRQIILTYEAGLENYDCPQLNQTIMQQLLNVVKELRPLYNEKSRSFTIILNEFERMNNQLTLKLDQEVIESDYVATEDNVWPEHAGSRVKQPMDLAIRYAYVRLFHRNMHHLLSPHASLQWIRPLLDSVKNAEKHGLTVYSNEEDAKRSLRNEHYGYLTIRLAPNQDITAERTPRHDPQLNCPLLAIRNISIDDFIRFSFSGHDFPIRKGVLYRPKSITEGQ